MDLLAYPMAFVAGRARTVDDASEEGITQQLRLLCATRRGERALVPAFGIADPAFRTGVDLVDVQTGVELFGPAGVQVALASTKTATAEVARLTWTRASDAVVVDAGLS